MPQKYSIDFVNNGNQPWYFYVYQQAPEPEIDLFSLAWLVSETAIRQGDHVKMTWSVDYNFVWGETGTLKPGVTFSAGGTLSCTPSGSNMTKFNVPNNTPGLSAASAEPPTGTLIIHDNQNVPADTFSVGIGMSNAGTFVKQAGPSLTHHFTPTPTYYVAAGENTQVGTVLDIQTITPTKEARFGDNVYDITATLGSNNEWTFKNTYN